MLKFVCWSNVLLENCTRSCKIKLCLWDCKLTGKMQAPSSGWQYSLVANLTQANNKMGAGVDGLNDESSSKLFIYLNATSK